jgi:EAL domain-containing protein (putative c-di-GMP-specific phosphodiesterase class I)
VGMLTKITNWMISNTLKSLHRWNQEDIQINLNFNLSSQYLLSNPELTFISQSLIENNINPADIIISLNEDCLSNETSQLSDIIIRLKDLGIALMLSEFAKNSTHLQKIKLFDFSMVRFDKSLIREIGKDQFSQVILKSMMDVIRKLGIKSVASGIENENQENFLLEQRCQLGQGFLYSDPLTENQMRQLMLKKRR